MARRERTGNEKIRILVLAANPMESKRLDLEEEVREIERKLEASQYRDNFELVPKLAIQAEDLHHNLLKYKPHIVHFTGHGSTRGEIIVRGRDGRAKRVGKKGLSGLFRTLKDNVRVVVLSACHTKEQAEGIAEVIDCVVGIPKTITQSAAIAFAAAFYEALGFGRSVQEAFDLGVNRLELEGIGEEETPALVVRDGVNPAKVRLVGGEEVRETGDESEDADAKEKEKTVGGVVLWPEVSVPFGGVKVSEPFAGREEELKELKKALRGKKTIAAVVGMAGQGKSCLAGEWFKRGAKPPEGTGLFWRRVYEAGYSFDKFVNELHVYLTGQEINAQEVRTVEGRAALALAALKERPCWIVLDGMERWLKRWAAEPDAGVEKLTVDDRAGQDEVLDKFLKEALFWENGSRLVLTTRAVPSALDENPPVMVGQEHGCTSSAKMRQICL